MNLKPLNRLLLNAAYHAEVASARIQGIAFDNPKWNGEYKLIDMLAPSLRMVVDGGGNIGDWTQHALKRSKDCSIIVVEPLPANVAHLKARFSTLNNRVEVAAAALGATSGWVRFSGENVVGSGVGFIEGNPRESGEETRCMTLDEMSQERGNCAFDLVKLDIEGDEMSALNGASNLFADRKIGAVQLEYNITWLRTGKRLYHLFELAQKYAYYLMLLTPLGPMDMPQYGNGLEDFRLRNIVLARKDIRSLLKPMRPAGRVFVESAR